MASVEGINLEKVDTNKLCKIDTNFVILLGKCQTTKKLYLIKYAKRITESNHISDFNVLDFKLVGAYPIDEDSYNSLSDGSSNRQINTSNLVGAPTCPCCGNQLGLVICECGNIFCVGEDARAQCPWCGLEGELSAVGGGIDINRTRG